MNLLLIDNYDSFTYNLVQYFRELSDCSVTVRRNDEVGADEPDGYDALVFSPGPGIPSEAGAMLDLIRRYAGQKPMLGVCLGHQAIAEAFGGKLENMTTVFHGVATEIGLVEPGSPLFAGLPPTFPVGRYHSWTVREEPFPAELLVTARDLDGRIMALQHRRWPIYGLQFHPESILTPLGISLLRNFLTCCRVQLSFHQPSITT
ncbi:MAG: aminodeoxychorismate/anthranilate synthase component II [Saprospiraceae bacterium]|nr:aminodeoxychorismate/anthranilate synthase component II [Saprospiraceae bacterium]